ncbi:MAG: SusC/RagA family TonB-linked outer membrane protein [Ferruginibacter sp.]|nr:SusC/RagA family TonB-linked outer membrane protein [Ferruginibacter sp.]
MRKLIRSVLWLLLLFVSSSAFSQTVSGVVKDAEDGKAIAGASIIVKGKTNGTKTDANGRFTIDAKKGDLLLVTHVGHAPQKLNVGAATNYDIKIAKADEKLEDVLVTTALGIRKKAGDLTHSAQVVGGPTIQESQRENFLNALDGRVAGLTINSTSGMAGASASIVLRGFNSLALDNSPLFVVDGIIMDNSTINETSNSGTGLGLVEVSSRNVNQTANRSTDYTNRIADINPADIENLTVLKGPEASALYGSQASSGAIIITTRKGRTDGKKTWTYDNSFKMSKLTRFPEISTKWASGTNGANTGRFDYFGRERDASIPTYDNIGNFFQNSFTHNHNLTFETGNTKYSFRGSANFLVQSGIVPFNEYKKSSLRLNYTRNISKYIVFAPSITLTNSLNDKPKRGAGGYLISLLTWPVTDDAREYETADGRKETLYSASPNDEIDNPFFNVQNNRGYDATKRIILTSRLTINPAKWITINGSFGLDKFGAEGWSFYHPLSNILTKGTGGTQDNYYTNYNGYNHTITAVATKKISKFSARIMVGTTWQDNKRTMYSVYGTNIVDSVNSAGYMVKNNVIVSQQDILSMQGDSSITRASSRLRLSRAKINNEPNYVQSRQSSYLGEFSINYNEAVYFNITQRFEESSIFPKNFRKYNYPAGGASLIMSKIFPNIKDFGINYWKIRASLANTARSPASYMNQSVFGNSLSSGGGFFYGFYNNNEFMEPEIQKTYEVGTEVRLFKDNVGIDFSYYNTTNYKQIVEGFRSSYGTGFVLNTLNAATGRNQGVEITLDFTPVKSRKLLWKSQINFNHMWNEVLELPANVPEFYISDTWVYGSARGGIVKGGQTTSITSAGYARNNKGDVLINALTGLPEIDATFRPHGDRNPDFTMGWTNSFKFNRVTFSFLWDVKKGGDIFNATEMYLTTKGLSKRTDDRYTPRVVQGVLKDGLENSANPTANTISVIPAFNQAYYTTNMPEEEFIEKDVNWVRLREATIRYNFSNYFVKKLRVVTGLSAFVTGNDLLLFTNYSGADPAANANTAGTRGVGAWGFDYGNTATPITINAGFKVSF